jgi:hypothetical protein
MLAHASVPRYLRHDLASPSLLAVLLFLSLGVNVVMTLRLRSVVARLEQPTTLKIGDLAPSVRLLDLEGRQTRLEYGTGRATIVYYFSPDCPWSRRNSQNIFALAASTAQRYRFISYTYVPMGHKEDGGVYNAPMPILVDDANGPRSLRMEYKLVGTPQTLVVSSDGHVVRNWQGAYVGEVRSEIERFFGVQLPGLSSERGQEDEKR